MSVRKVTLSGPFTDDDLEQLAALLRRIDEANPTGLYALTVTDGESDMDQSEALMRRLLPPIPERTTAFARASYRDDSFPERACDRCGRLYRGPAVYCALECAIADA